jgi:hypothetical protein
VPVEAAVPVEPVVPVEPLKKEKMSDFNFLPATGSTDEGWMHF